MSNHTYPSELAIAPLAKPVNATVTVPGSKSITNRALVLAALVAEETSCVLSGALRSEDTEVMADSLRRLGYTVDWHAGGNGWLSVTKPRGHRHEAVRSATLFVANSGTTMRFLTAFVCLLDGEYRLDGIPRMRERPVADLLDALRLLGADVRSEANNGCPPVEVHARGLAGGLVRVKGDVSSQFLSALLMVAPYARRAVTLEVVGPLVSVPYVEMTIRQMQEFGCQVSSTNYRSFHIEPNQKYQLGYYTIEPDASAASYFWAAAAIAGGRVTVSGLTRASLQGDVRFVDVLGQMGCRVEECAAGITVHGGPLRGVDVDMNDISDTVMTLGAVALFAEGPTTIRNVAHIRHKETDRIAALATELRKLGAEVEERPDGLTITPKPLTGVAVDTYNDHRMAMSLALVGLKVPGVVIRNPGCVAKTYPGFWQDLDALRS